MKLPGLIHFSLTLILASTAKGQTWNINVTRHVNATLGSDVTIPCTFTYPPKYYTEDVEVYWKKPGRSNFRTNDNDKNAFIFHPNDTFVLEKYRGKTRLVGNKAEGSCSLMIKSIKENEPNMYVRVIAKGDQFSFIKKYVSISVPGVAQVTLTPDILNISSPAYEKSTMTMTQKTSTATYTVIFVPVAALVILVFLVGIFFCIKHKRSKSFTREDSGHYANVSSASSNQVKREAPCAKQDKEKLHASKAIDEPVYINLEASSDHMDQGTHHTENIYANMDYSK